MDFEGQVGFRNVIMQRSVFSRVKFRGRFVWEEYREESDFICLDIGLYWKGWD